LAEARHDALDRIYPLPKTYTAYTFIAVSALAFGAGAISFFAVPYTIIIYPILFVVFPRLVCGK